jgi:hypothetical protein
LARRKASVVPVIVVVGAAGFLLTFVNAWLIQAGVAL